MRFTFAVDERNIDSYVDTQRRWASANGGSNVWDIAVNLSVGGNWVGDPDEQLGLLSDLNRCAQDGTPSSGCSSKDILRAEFPSTYEVDYVRVYKD